MVTAQVPAVLQRVPVPLALTGSPLERHIGCSMRILRHGSQIPDPNGDAHEGVLSLILPLLPEALVIKEVNH